LKGLKNPDQYFLKRKKKKDKKLAYRFFFFHRLIKSTEVVTIPANAPTNPTTAHLV
jgi:hypothetical protein